MNSVAVLSMRHNIALTTILLVLHIKITRKNGRDARTADPGQYEGMAVAQAVLLQAGAWRRPCVPLTLFLSYFR
jgi:hypothetical protein